MALTERVASQTVFGGARAGAGAGLVAVNTPSGTASGVVLVSADGTETLLWARNNGKLYRGTRGNFATPESAGTALD